MNQPFTTTTLEKQLIQQAAFNHSPVTGTLELLPLCNMRCDMCYIRLDRDEMNRQGHLYSADEWIRLAEQMAKSGVLFLLLTGGEPLLFPDFRKLYLRLQQLGMILTINTNGTLIDEEWADFFAQNKPRRINVTLYGTDEETYENLCHYSGGFSKTIQGIKLLKEQGIDVKINGSVTKRNVQDTEKIYCIGRELDIPVHMDTYMLPGIQDRYKPFKQQTRLNPEDSALAKIQTMKEEMTSDSFYDYVNQAIDAVENKEQIYPDCLSCQAAASSFAIGWQGLMRPCVSLSEPSVNVFETGFDSGWTKIVEEAKQLRVNEKCTSCRLRPICNTCAASACWETGSYDSIPDYNCRCAEEFLRLLYQEQQNVNNAGNVDR